MVTTLTGSNTFILQQQLRKLVSDFVAEQGDMGLERVDGEEATYERIGEAITSLPFLTSKKMVVLRSPSANKQFIEKAEQLLGDVPETTDVIIVETKLDKRLSYYKFLKKQASFHEFNELDNSGLAQWLAAAAKEQGGVLSIGDARHLVERVGANQQLLFSELEKLLLYNPQVTHQTIDLLTDPAPQSTVFQLLEAAFAGNHKRALQLYSEQRALKVEPQIIIAMLVWQLHLLALVKTAGSRSTDDIAKQAKLNPYSVQKSQSIARHITLARLKQLTANLLQIDTRSKRTSLDLDEALQHYLLTLTSV